MKTDFEKKELSGKGLRFAIVVARWNTDLTLALANGAKRAFDEAGVGPDDVELFQVPGAFELPSASFKLAETGEFNAIVALGVVIRGDTPHFDFVAGQAAAGLLQAGLDSGIPVMFGVITADNIGQALARAGDGDDNKGYEAAISGLEMAVLFRQIDARSDS